MSSVEEASVDERRALKVELLLIQERPNLVKPCQLNPINCL